ncbi:hypothetical protein [Streptomyces yunnanensis]|uniref:Uncharacterized protein n=1 Tax=Streptomyces yunnanensis TaxID=156453 RepID=A0A9X8N1S3_9ACTN|nr:hypothetical protein [Streptomyces yunnanensis]SHM67214.1 hypothetical protein SAMN05216268_11317 [Streptomyces yunnanensis]
MRTHTSVGVLVAAGGLALGLMTAPACAAPHATAFTSPATVQLAGGGWNIKDAMNVADSGAEAEQDDGLHVGGVGRWREDPR